MICYLFSISTPVRYDDTGKFESPSPDWIHIKIGLDDFELIVMTKGTLYLQYQEVKYSISPGEFLLLPPSESGMREGFKKSDCCFYWLHFTYRHPVQTIDSHSLPENYKPGPDQILVPARGTLAQPEKAIVLLRLLQDYVRSQYLHVTKNYLSTLVLCEINSQSALILSKGENPCTIPYQKQLYNDILDYIKDHIRQDLKVNDIADHFGYNGKYLSHAFKEIVGMTLKQYIIKIKMEEAAFLLTDTNVSIKEVSDLLGYSDSHNFMKLFKRQMGLTPSEYRNSHSKRILNHI